MTNKTCCQSNKNNKRGLLSGLLFGLLPHSFCIGFLVFSVVGATVATTFFRQFLLIPNLFPLLIVVSFFLATIAALLSPNKSKRYLLTLYGTTIIVNLLIFKVLFPATANIQLRKISADQNPTNAQVTLKVKIPCSGHSLLIADELRKTAGVGEIGRAHV